jgi:glycosyltransferase involved in cell wall biosynthesis
MVTIGVPTYNGGGKMLRTMLSICEQEYPNLEVIISDNCSSDNTEELCHELQRRFPFIRYFRQTKNIGLIPNFEFVLRMSTGRYFMWAADDDELEPGILKKYVTFLTKHPDYKLVSGRILHWSGDTVLYCERNFSIEHKFPGLRAIRYYSKVIYGSMYYGLMCRESARLISLKNRLGEDWHFVASMAFLGKIKNLSCVGYNKKSGGVSRNFKEYAKAMGAGRWSAEFPHIKIAINAFTEILSRPSVYTHSTILPRVFLAAGSFAVIILNHYITVYPLIIGGKVKRYFLRIYERWIPEFKKIRDEISFPEN